MKPTIGRIVFYRLTAHDANTVNAERQQDGERRGNQPYEGQMLPLMITEVHSDTCINGRLFLDGNDDQWLTSLEKHDTNLGAWSWPPREA